MKNKILNLSVFIAIWSYVFSLVLIPLSYFSKKEFLFEVDQNLPVDSYLGTMYILLSAIFIYLNILIIKILISNFKVFFNYKKFISTDFEEKTKNNFIEFSYFNLFLALFLNPIMQAISLRDKNSIFIDVSIFDSVYSFFYVLNIGVSILSAGIFLAYIFIKKEEKDL